MRLKNDEYRKKLFGLFIAYGQAKAEVASRQQTHPSPITLKDEFEALLKEALTDTQGKTK